HVAEAAFDQFAHLSDGTGMDDSMIPGQPEASARGFFDHSRSFLRRRSHRLFEEVLRDPRVDAIAIATPVFTHFKLAMQAMMAGKHVFVEKP
ncbi:Gfo/Idh/MocA family oxidoreductase, partial [Rhizobium ruizarguesonis]